MPLSRHKMWLEVVFGKIWLLFHSWSYWLSLGQYSKVALFSHQMKCFLVIIISTTQRNLYRPPLLVQAQTDCFSLMERIVSERTSLTQPFFHTICSLLCQKLWKEEPLFYQEILSSRQLLIRQFTVQYKVTASSCFFLPLFCGIYERQLILSSKSYFKNTRHLQQPVYLCFVFLDILYLETLTYSLLFYAHTMLQ